jgi:hypothetical protein
METFARFRGPVFEGECGASSPIQPGMPGAARARLTAAASGNF